jgi:hypothetical protein
MAGRSALRTVVTAVLVFIALQVAPLTAIADDSEVSWSASGLGVWRYDANAGVWVDAPGGIAEDPNIYPCVGIRH